MEVHFDKAVVDITLTTIYRRTDKPANQFQIRDTLRYTDLKGAFVHGNGDNRANLNFYTRSTLDNSMEHWNLDGILQDVYGNFLNYDSVKGLIIFNRQPLTDDNFFLSVQFKNERYYIGPQGFRILWEPKGQGVSAVQSSQSAEEGLITVESNANITYDIFIIGSSAESSDSGQ